MCSAYSESTFWQGLLQLRLVPALGVESFITVLFLHCLQEATVHSAGEQPYRGSCFMREFRAHQGGKKSALGAQILRAKSKASLVTALPRRFSIAAPHTVSPGDS